jgi:hypothetical protein
VIPPLIGMIAMGFLSRNFMGGFMNAYPTNWSAYIRIICLCMILMRGGLTVSFRGKSLTVILLSVVPQFIEASVAALVAYFLFGMPYYVAYTLGYTFACVGPSIVDPCLMVLTRNGYGIKKGISSTLISAGIFDDVLCNICFVICKAIAFSHIGTGDSGRDSLILVFVEVFTGIGGGVLLGLLGYFFKYISNVTVRMWAKFAYCMLMVIGFPVTSQLTGFTEIRFIGILFCGYTLFRVWGLDKPSRYLDPVWEAL